MVVPYAEERLRVVKRLLLAGTDAQLSAKGLVAKLKSEAPDPLKTNRPFPHAQPNMALIPHVPDPMLFKLTVAPGVTVPTAVLATAMGAPT